MSASAKPGHRVDPDRFQEAMRRAGYAKPSGEVNKNKLAKALGGMSPSNVKRWLDGETTPAGKTLDLLCTALRVTPAFLFGSEAPDSQAVKMERVIADVERALGQSARDALRSLMTLTPHHRSLAVASLQGWIQALREVEKATGQMPLTEFEIDEAEQLRAKPAAVSATEQSESAGPSR